MLKLIAGLCLSMMSVAAFAQGTNRSQQPYGVQPMPSVEDPATTQPGANQYTAPYEEEEVEYYYEDEDLDNRWYLGVGAGMVISDSDDIDSGYFFNALFGKPISEYFGFDLEVNYSKLDVARLSSAEDYKRLTFGADMLFYPWRGDWQPYLMIGLNGHKVKHVQEDLTGWGWGPGFGLQRSLGNRIALDLRARYAIDNIQGEGLVLDNKFYLWTANVGLLFKLGEWPLDSDGDGVPDKFDKCPNTPRGVQVDKDGCPLDSDGDGVPDYLDKCPNTPPGVLVDKDGCPLDSDGDGVPDRLDKCPGTPPGVTVDRDGCPIDSDQDGVPDYLDKCPNTMKGLQVDKSGCPVKAQAIPLDGVHFEFDKDRLTPDSRTILDHVASTMKESPGLKFEIAGHTCNLGSAAYNLRLSDKRAASVREYLISKGIPAGNVTSKGYGFTQPRVPNDTEAHRELNRRVELRILE
jgi:OOP family OmpA-OmpF porin